MRLNQAEIYAIEQVVEEFCNEETINDVTDGQDVDFITYAFPTDTGRYFEIIYLIATRVSIVNEITEDEFLDVVRESS